MKTEQKLEIYRELFGSLPDVPEGKELIGIEYRPPKEWEIYHFSNIWLENVAGDYGEEDKRMVAIFQDTHRPDGTPLSIDPLPEVEGYRVEYKGVCITPDHVTDEVLIYDHVNKIWIRYPSVWQPNEVINSHWCNLYKIAQPTTLADLVGKHGQNNVWLHTSSEGAFAALVDFRDGRIHYVDGKMIECLIKYNYRWSNDPFTKYADAKEFIPE